MTNLINVREQDYCFLGKGCRIKGDVHLEGVSRLAGLLEGGLSMAGRQTLTIGPSGFLKGTLNCHDLEVFGRIQGKIVSSGKVTLFPSAEVDIELTAESLVVHPGAMANIVGLAGNP